MCKLTISILFFWDSPPKRPKWFLTARHGNKKLGAAAFIGSNYTLHPIWRNLVLKRIRIGNLTLCASPSGSIAASNGRKCFYWLEKLFALSPARWSWCRVFTGNLWTEQRGRIRFAMKGLHSIDKHFESSRYAFGQLIVCRFEMNTCQFKSILSVIHLISARSTTLNV